MRPWNNQFVRTFLILATAASMASAATITWDGGGVNNNAQWNTTGDNWDSTSFSYGNTIDLAFYSSLGTYANSNKTFLGNSAATCRSLTMNSTVNAEMIIRLDNNGTTTRHLVFDADSGSASLNVDAAAQGSLEITRTSSANGQVQLNDNLIISNASPSFMVTFNRPIVDGTLVGAGVTKAGVGTVVYGIANTYTGPTVVSGGRLTSMVTYLTGGGPVAVTNSGTLELVLGAAGETVNTSDLALGGSGGTATNEIDFGVTGNGTAPVFNATTFSTHGTTVLKIKGNAFAVGQFALIQYGGGSIGGSGFGALQLDTLPIGVSATLSNNTTAGSVDLVISSAIPTLSWNGNNGPDWDIGTTINWIDANTLAPSAYTEPGGLGAAVQFSDGATTTFANITTLVKPFTLTANASADFQWGGAGEIGGSVQLSKIGSGTLSISNANSYTGGSSLVAGRVALGNDNALGGGTITFDGGGLSSLGSATRTVTNAVNILSTASFGDLSDNGELILSGPVTFNGGLRDYTSHSDVKLTGTIGDGSFGIKEGTGTVTLNTLSGVQTVSGNWQLQQGDMVVDGGSFSKGGGLRVMNTHPGEQTVFSLTNGAVIDFTGSGVNIRIGSTSPAGDSTATNIVNIGGTITCGTGLGCQIGGSSALAQLNLLSGGSLQLTRFIEQGGGVSSEVNFNGGTLIAFADRTDFMTGLANAFVRSGGAVIDTSTNNITIAQSLVDGGGNGGLTKDGAGRLDLDGANTFTGLTTVSAGTLGGAGSITGPVQVNGSGTLSAGAAGTIGTLTINSNLTLAGTVRLDLDASVIAADLIAGLNNVTYGGNLVVSNLSGTPLASGQVYQLFNAVGTKTANFSTVVLEGAGAAGLAGAFNPATGELTISTAALPQPTVTQVVVSGGNLILQGTNGAPSGTFAILTSTNVTLPLANWITNTTDTFTAGGTFSNSIPVTSEPQRYFLIKQP